MKLGTRVGSGLALLLFLIFALAGWELLLIERLHQANRRLAGTDLEVSRTSLRMRQEIDRLIDLTERFFVLRDPGYVAELRRVRELATADFQRLLELPLEAGERGTLLGLSRSWRTYARSAETIEPAVPAGEEDENGRSWLLAQLERMRSEVEALDREAVERVAARIEESTATAARARRLALLVGSGGVALALVLAIWLSHGTVRPLRALASGARAISRGELEHRVEVKGPVEVESLARDFNDMARRLAEVDRTKRDFLSSISHDLKAPLASMQETTRLLLEDRGLDDDQRRLLELHDECSERLQRMIGDLLDSARLEAGAVEFELETVDLVAHCRQALAEAGGLFEAGRVRLETDWPDEPVPVRADSRFLLQALWNVVSNAAKFSPEETTVRVALHRLDDRERLPSPAFDAPTPPRPPVAIVRVSDEGPGVADEDKPRVFDRFYRSRVHERYASGTGLGLAIARSILEAMGGSIWVEDRPGGGSVFAMLLPLHRATPGAADR